MVSFIIETTPVEDFHPGKFPLHEKWFTVLHDEGTILPE